MADNDVPDTELEFSLKLPADAKQLVRTPQFPGIFGFLPQPELERAIKIVRKFIMRQKKARGFKFGVSSGANDPFNIDLSGVAKIFLGFALLTDPTLDFTDLPENNKLEINDEIVIQNVHINFFGFQFTDNDYYSFIRPLSGTDTIQYNVIGLSDINVFVIVYYI